MIFDLTTLIENTHLFSYRLRFSLLADTVRLINSHIIIIIIIIITVKIKKSLFMHLILKLTTSFELILIELVIKIWHTKHVHLIKFLMHIH